MQSPVEVTTDAAIQTTIDDQNLHDSRNESTDKQTETPNIKVLDNTSKSLESASKVLLPIIQNDSSNDLTYQVRRRNTTIDPPRIVEVPKKPTRHIIKNEYRTHVQYDEVTGELIGGEHPCQRECKEGDEPMICYYHFSLELYMTMSKACFDCPYNETDCDRIDCIPADGISRPLTVINRKMPGPSIEVRYSLIF